MTATVWTTVFLLFGSNIFMTFAWYAHLRNLHDQAWYIAALTELGHCLFEICYRCRRIVWAIGYSISRN